MSQFYALMSDNTVKYISLNEDVVNDIRNIFISGAARLKTIIRKTKCNPLFKRSDKTRKTKCTFEKSPFPLHLRTK